MTQRKLMYPAGLDFAAITKQADEPADLILRLLVALRNSGQVLDQVFSVAALPGGYSAPVLLPAANALDSAHSPPWVQRAEEALVRAGVSPTAVSLLGKDPTSPSPCTCSSPSSYILFTDFLSVESPLRCGDEFLPVPLYRVPLSAEGERQGIVFWAPEYRACDHLWMSSDVLERAAYRQLQNYESRLTQLGLEVRDGIASVTQRPVYYYLLGLQTRNWTAQMKRRCPHCGGEWLLGQPWHGIFDFRCDRCHLLSDMPADVHRR